MGKRVLSVVLALVLCVSLLPVTTRAAEVANGTCGRQGDNLTWTLDDAGTLTISGTGEMQDYIYYYNYYTYPWYRYRSRITSAIIEQGVTNIGSNAFNGCNRLTSVSIPNSVTSIGSFAFHDCSSLTSVSIPNSVTSVGEYAFCDCNHMTSVSIPNSVTSIGGGAFHGCSSLSSVTLPNSITSIGDAAFRSCYRLTSVNIPDSVISIGDGAFDDCKNLIEITVSSNNKSVKAIDGVLFNVDGKTLLSYPAGKASLSYIIPAGVTSIGNYAFNGCKSLTSVSIPDSVTSIRYRAFRDCSNLTSVNIPDSVTSIGGDAFYDCSSLKSVNIPDGVTSIGEGTFYGCKSLASINIPNSVTSIGSFAFHDCSSLKSVSIPNGVDSVGEYTFYYCSSLKSVSIPSSVTYIGNWAFNRCTSLARVSIPNGVTYIGYYAFENCSSLKSVSISDSVTSIGNNAFYGCGSLKDVYYGGGEAQWKKIKFGFGSLKDVAIHYNSNVIIPTKAQTTISADQYWIQAVDENGNGLRDVTVEYGDYTGITNADGKISFAALSSEDLVIKAKKDGYTTWTNENSGWTRSKSGLETVILRSEGEDGYKLREARYSNNSQITDSTDLLTTTKKLNLGYEDGSGDDLFWGQFYIVCSAYNSNGVLRYELWQNSKKIAGSTTGRFDELFVDLFTQGGGCFIRVFTVDGTQVDTNINLEFAESNARKTPGVSILKNKIGITVADDVPFLGGSTFSVGGVKLLPVDIKQTDSKLYFGINAKIWDGDDTSGSQTKGSFEQFKKELELAKKANTILGKRGGKGASAMMSSLIKTEPDFALPGGSVKFNVVGFAEADWGSSTATGELYITFRATTPTIGFTTWVVVLPVTVQISGYLEAQLGAKVSYNWEAGTMSGEIPFEITLGLDAFVGMGVGTVVGMGIYGSADVAFDMQLFVEPILKSIDLSGELGLKAYIGPFEFNKSFAQNTWNLYTANNVSLLSAAPAWNEGLYDASSYAVGDLSYLTAESDWLDGNSISLLSAGAKTTFSKLLTNTYRNAQPVMVSSGDALYAAFIRADAKSGSRYVVVTRSKSGTAWSSPVRTDADAILDDAPTLCVGNDGTVWLAYARTTAEPDESLLTYAQNQEIVVGSVDPDTLTFTEYKTFAGSGFAHMQQLAVINDQPVLMWADTALTDENSVLLPTSGTIRYSVYSGSMWSDAAELTSVTGALTSVTAGAQNGKVAAAYVSDGTLYCATAEQTVELATDVTGNVRYGVLPSTSEATFLWNGDGVLCSSNGDEISAEGISHEYAIVGDKVYYSMATDNSANLAVLQYENGNWSLPIQLTGDSRYLENLSVARLDGSDYVMGMHTAVTITEDSVEDAKNLVVSRVTPVSDLRIEYVDYDYSSLMAGESVPVTLTVTNAGDHTVNSIDLTLDGTPIKSETVELLPGQSTEIETEITCPSALTSYVFTVSETDENDYTPADNEYELSIGYADAEVELDYQQIGTSKALVATVTNQGIDAASGSVIFYDADGNPVAESTFEDLASGDVAIASYAVTESFAGVNGGDVSAKVVLDQDELYTYNNEVTMHILKAYTPTSIKSVEVSQSGITAEIVFEEDVHATVLCATYDNLGKMLHVESESVDALEGETYTFDFVAEDADVVKVFVLDDDAAPLCEAREPVMQTE